MGTFHENIPELPPMQGKTTEGPGDAASPVEGCRLSTVSFLSFTRAYSMLGVKNIRGSPTSLVKKLQLRHPASCCVLGHLQPGEGTAPLALLIALKQKIRLKKKNRAAKRQMARIREMENYRCHLTWWLPGQF